MIGSFLKTNFWTYKIKDLHGKKIKGIFYEKKLLLSKLKMIQYSQPDSYIRDKVKIVLELTNYATKKELKNSTGVNTSNLTAKWDFNYLKA